MAYFHITYQLEGSSKTFGNAFEISHPYHIYKEGQEPEYGEFNPGELRIVWWSEITKEQYEMWRKIMIEEE